jgi:hypothetical protein
MAIDEIITNANKLQWSDLDFWNKICPSLTYSSMALVYAMDKRSDEHTRNNDFTL